MKTSAATSSSLARRRVVESLPVSGTDGRQAPMPGTRGLVAHAAWLPPVGSGEHALALWAEVEAQPVAARHTNAPPGADARPRTHPFAAQQAELYDLLDRLWRTARPGVKPRTTCTPARLTIWLPRVGTRPTPSPELQRAGWAAPPASHGEEEHVVPSFALWRTPALALDTESAATLLAGLPRQPNAEALAAHGAEGAADGRPSSRIVLGGDLHYWATAAAFALDLLLRQRFVPGVLALPDDDLGYFQGPRLASFWYAALGDHADAARFEALAVAMPDLCRAAVSASVAPPAAERVPAARPLLEDFLHTTLSARIAKWLAQDSFPLDVPRPANVFNYRARGYYEAYRTYNSRAARWLRGLRAPGRPLDLTIQDAELLRDGVQRWHAGLALAHGVPFRLCLRLAPPAVSAVSPAHGEPPDAGVPAEEAAEETAEALADAPWRLDFLLQARDDLSLLVPLEDVWRERGAVAHLLDRRFEHPHERVLAALGQAARLFPPIERSLEGRHPAGLTLSPGEAYNFLRDAAPLLEDAGLGVLVPSWWIRAQVKPTLRLRLRGAQKTSTGLMGLDALVAYDWQVALGGDELSREELERLAALKEPLVRLRGRWVELPRDQMEAALRFVRGNPGGAMSLAQALQTSLTGEVASGVDGALQVEEVRTDEWIGGLLGRLGRADAPAEVAPPDSLTGTLRPYQLRGLGWLDFLARYGLGACLADDMGLGKSIQLLCLILNQKEAGLLTKPALLVCPTSVVGNWRHEAARFAPALRLLIHHGAARLGRRAAQAFADEVAGHDLVITTYSLLPRDAAVLSTVAWGAVVLDEAQNIKNAEAKQSRAARKLTAPVRVALTGTPVENRLSELWAIMDFLNPGYLGAQQRFQQRFALPIEKARDADATERLQRLVRPFVLRRLKSDPAVITDLPEKIEVREYCSLTREQVTLYEAVVRDGLRRVEEAAGDMERRGAVLATLTRLKQVCNHPAHLLDDGSALEGRSGKLTRLEELIEELLAEGDRALLFTQFTALGDRLRPYLAQRFGVDVLYLHGGVPRTKREEIVARFQAEDGPPLFLLSLKAGGTGLNLTRANHVLHFDRWWNPAVENQATDRAFRIGQTRNVQVRKLICSGTLEERIDAMIEQKRGLAEHVIGAGEGWLTEMSTTELRELFSLRTDALAE